MRGPTTLGPQQERQERTCKDIARPVDHPLLLTNCGGTQIRRSAGRILQFLPGLGFALQRQRQNQLQERPQRRWARMNHLRFHDNLLFRRYPEAGWFPRLRVRSP